MQQAAEQADRLPCDGQLLIKPAQFLLEFPDSLAGGGADRNGVFCRGSRLVAFVSDLYGGNVPLFQLL